MRQGYWARIIIPYEVKPSMELLKIEGHLGRIDGIKNHPTEGPLVKFHNLQGLVPACCVKEVSHIEEEEWNKKEEETKALVKVEK